MNIDEAKNYLKASSKPEYHSYIETQLAGDFAVSIAQQMSEMRGSLTECNKVANEWEGGLAEKISFISSVPLSI
ncbi:MAG: hypothetical protein DRQ62_14475 [Gammaproteobacteria bacterium]|nr:MAG: hypothetical protein DRQ62_14475 [Gammaproteobacteria bacterium]